LQFRFDKLQNYASSLVYLNKLLKEESGKLSSLAFSLDKKELFQRRLLCLERLGWEHIIEVEKTWIKKRYPQRFEIF